MPKLEMLEMRVAAVTHDPGSNRPVLILKNDDAGKILPIWIGPYEAYAIMAAIEGVEPTRPLTHDLIKGLLAAMDAEVERVVINDLADNTFYALIVLDTHTGRLEVDARPSDAIAVALRVGAPIYVSRTVLDTSGATAEGEIEEPDRFRKMLADLKPEDFDFDKPS